MDTLIAVDMQVGMLDGAPKLDLQGVINRINSLSRKHCGCTGDRFERHTPGRKFLPELIRRREDLVVEKTLNDPYVGTSVGDTLARMRPHRVMVTGWATDFCVDATVRSTVSRDHNMVAVSDAHTLSDRPHLPATAVIAHHKLVMEWPDYQSILFAW